MRRREFLGAISAAATWPLAADAQQPTIPTIGFVHLTSLEDNEQNLAAFRQGLGDIGYSEGRNVVIEYRWAEGQNNRLPVLIGELVRRQVSVIVILESTHSCRGPIRSGSASSTASTDLVEI